MNQAGIRRSIETLLEFGFTGQLLRRTADLVECSDEADTDELIRLASISVQGFEGAVVTSPEMAIKWIEAAAKSFWE